jgi:hypothetical protein
MASRRSAAANASTGSEDRKPGAAASFLDPSLSASSAGKGSSAPSSRAPSKRARTSSSAASSGAADDDEDDEDDDDEEDEEAEAQRRRAKGKKHKKGPHKHSGKKRSRSERDDDDDDDDESSDGGDDGSDSSSEEEGEFYAADTLAKTALASRDARNKYLEAGQLFFERKKPRFMERTRIALREAGTLCATGKPFQLLSAALDKKQFAALSYIPKADAPLVIYRLYQRHLAPGMRYFDATLGPEASVVCALARADIDDEPSLARFTAPGRSAVERQIWLDELKKKPQFISGARSLSLLALLPSNVTGIRVGPGGKLTLDPQCGLERNAHYFNSVYSIKARLTGAAQVPRLQMDAVYADLKGRSGNAWPDATDEFLETLLELMAAAAPDGYPLASALAVMLWIAAVEDVLILDREVMTNIMEEERSLGSFYPAHELVLPMN